MASTVFVDNSSIIYASWLNDINATTYNGTFISSTITPSNLVCNGSVSGTGFTGLVNNTLSAPGQIGNGTANTGAFTTLSTSGLATLSSLSLTTALSIANGGTGLTAAGSAGSVLTSNGTSWSIAPKITSGTAVTASGSSISFTSIPSWVKRITLMFQSLVSSSQVNIQLGTAGGLATTGYLGSVMNENTSNNSVGNLSTAFNLQNSGTQHGIITFANISGNNWVASGTMGWSNTSLIGYISGSIALSGVLTQLNLSGTFSSGSINILYE